MASSFLLLHPLIGPTTSLLLSTINFTSTHLFIPLLLPLAPSTSTPIFAGLYRRGLATVVPLAIFSTLASFTSAYFTPGARNGLIACGVLTIGNMIWTGAVMLGTNARLCEIGDGDERVRAKADEGELKVEVIGLLKQWGWMNLVRSGICGVGAVIGFVSIFTV